jgi:imidazole glycerol-phosphate synthase subunit HisH
MKLVVVDYGMGNLRSVQKALQTVAPEHTIDVSADPVAVDAADRVVFPGQGAMPDCMRELHASGLADAVLRATRTRPFLGLCVGMQMLFDQSEEGDTPGLGVFDGHVVRFQMPAHSPNKVPHMGWNQVTQAMAHPVFAGIADGARFYHVHSYYARPQDATLTAATTDYAGRFTSAIARDNIFCTQFHPEKSGDTGLQLLANFVGWQPQ